MTISDVTSVEYREGCFLDSPEKWKNSSYVRAPKITKKQPPYRW